MRLEVGVEYTDIPDTEWKSIAGLGEQLNLHAAMLAFGCMDKYVPYLTGMLSTNADVYADADGGYVHYKQPYAHRQYEGDWFNHTLDFHPLATSRWDVAFMTNEGDRFVKELDAYRKKIANDK